MGLHGSALPPLRSCQRSKPYTTHAELLSVACSFCTYKIYTPSIRWSHLFSRFQNKAGKTKSNSMIDNELDLLKHARPCDGVPFKCWKFRSCCNVCSAAFERCWTATVDGTTHTTNAFNSANSLVNPGSTAPLGRRAPHFARDVDIRASSMSVNTHTRGLNEPSLRMKIACSAKCVSTHVRRDRSDRNPITMFVVLLVAASVVSTILFNSARSDPVVASNIFATNDCEPKPSCGTEPTQIMYCPMFRNPISPWHDAPRL